MTNNPNPTLLAIDLSLNARSKMKDQKIDSILRYATNTDVDVFEKHKRISFFIRKPYVGELEFDLEFERIDKKILDECCSILCQKDLGIKGISLTEINHDRGGQARTRTFFDTKDTISFMNHVQPCFFDGIDLFASSIDLDKNGRFKKNA